MPVDALASLPALPPLVPVARAADLLGVSRSTAYALANSGQLPGVTKLGPCFVVRTAVLSRWLDGQTINP
jgi:predicted DNA-binding transcriptional regulator AlpA